MVYTNHLEKKKYRIIIIHMKDKKKVSLEKGELQCIDLIIFNKKLKKIKDYY